VLANRNHNLNKLKIGDTMKISIHNYTMGTQEFVNLPDDIKNVEDELTKLGYNIKNIEYMVLPQGDIS